MSYVTSQTGDWDHNLDEKADSKDLQRSLSAMNQSMLNRFSVWRPLVPESIDGKPLVTNVSQFYSNFPYHRLSENFFIALFLRPEFVLCCVILYLTSKPTLKALVKLVHWNPNNSYFRYFIAIHNIALAVFSGVVAYNSWPAVVAHLHSRGFMAVYCDQDGSLWTTGGLGAWATIFYISKYYEFLDTWILVLKGKEASFLQVYHHTGIVLCMYGGVASQSAWLLVVVLLNSVIHTLMYTYFFIKTISPQTEIKMARYLTKAQIGQFIIGIAVSAGVLFLGESCDTQSSRFALMCLQAYGYGLIALFLAFAKRKYKKG